MSSWGLPEDSCGLQEIQHCFNLAVWLQFPRQAFQLHFLANRTFLGLSLQCSFSSVFALPDIRAGCFKEPETSSSSWKGISDDFTGAKIWQGFLGQDNKRNRSVQSIGRVPPLLLSDRAVLESSSLTSCSPATLLENMYQVYWDTNTTLISAGCQRSSELSALLPPLNKEISIIFASEQGFLLTFHLLLAELLFPRRIQPTFPVLPGVIAHTASFPSPFCFGLSPSAPNWCFITWSSGTKVSSLGEECVAEYHV